MIDPADPIVLDSSVLVAYERMKTPGTYALHESQAQVAEWLRQEVTLLLPAASLAVASHECDGQLPELGFLIDGDPDQVIVVPLARESAVDVGAASADLTMEAFEVAHVVWCATGHDDDVADSIPWPVATYWPNWYAGSGIPVIAL